jgi:hypothetical protein
MRKVWQSLGMKPQTHRNSELNIPRDMNASERVVTVCKRLHARDYISGLGAMNYIDYELFENAGILIYYMDYRLQPYPQLHGSFTPYVSIVDLLFNVGIEDARNFLCSEHRYWKEWPHRVEGRPVPKPRLALAGSLSHPAA